jgi:hypothetical protein
VGRITALLIFAAIKIHRKTNDIGTISDTQKLL